MVSSVLILFMLVSVCSGDGGDGPETVKELDLPKYIGKWYQVYANLYVSQTKQPNAMCIMVDYSLHDNTSMLAITHSRLYSPHGSEMLTKAQIVCPDANVPGNLQLLVQGAPYPIPYMVILLGPVNRSNQYEYSVVTDTNKVGLYIYARDIEVFRRKYRHGVLEFCRNHDFDSYYNEPHETIQPKSCEYYDSNFNLFHGRHYSSTNDE